MALTMVSAEEIIKNMRIETTKNVHRMVPEVAEAPYNIAETPQTLENVNMILTRHGFPPLGDPGDMVAQLRVISALQEAFSCWDTLQINTEDASSQIAKIVAADTAERLCDIREVELANNAPPGVSKHAIGDLTSRVEALKAAAKAQQDLNPADRVALRSIFSEGATRSPAIATSLGFLRAATAGAALRQKARARLAASDAGWAKALAAIMDGTTSLNDLGTFLGLDRVGLLRVVYSLCSRGIIDYDRLSDTVGIAREKKTH